MKKLFFICGILFSVLSIQSQRKSIYFESHIFPKDSVTSECNLSYKIPFNKLVFTKNNGNYSGGVEINFEIYEGETIYRRVPSSKSVSIENYEETKSADNYLQGIVSFEISIGNYKVLPTINLENTKNEIPLKRYQFELTVPEDLNYALPTVVYNDLLKCDDVSGKRIVNMGDVIPFDIETYDMLITVFAQNISSVTVEVIQKSKTVNKKHLDKSISGNVKISDCENDIVYIVDKSDANCKMFLFKNISENLLEGSAQINIYSGTDTLSTGKFDVMWVNRPAILNNVELSAEIFKKVTGDDEIDSIFDAPEEEYYEYLFSYWKKLDPVKSTLFNELMKEFYERAEVAQEKFKTADNTDGSRTDRGIVFIKYGEPDDIFRNYGTKNKIIEIWKYEKSGKEFIFEDTTGLGNYQLVD